MSSSMTVQQPPAMQVGMMAPQVSFEQTAAMGGIMMEQQPVPTRIETMPGTTYGAPQTTTYMTGGQSGVMMGGGVGYEQTQAMPSMTYSMGPQTMGGAMGTTLVAEPVATRIESPQQEGFMQHAMHTVGNALGLGGSNTTYVQGGTAYGQGGGLTIASAPSGGVTYGAPGVTYGAPGAMTTTTTGGYAVGAPGAMTTTTTGGYAVAGAGSASMFDQIDTNHDGVISRAEFAQVQIQQ